MAAMKRVAHTLTYPGTTLARVHEMLADPAFRKAVADHQGVQDFSCQMSTSGGTLRVRIEQAHGTSRIPPFAQKLVGDEIRFVQEETWSTPDAADLHVHIPGKPGEMTGSLSLAQAGDDVVERVDLAVKVGLPLVGGKLEDLVAGFLGSAFAAENRVGVKWLGGEWRS
jgi:hypothetical protein